MKKITLGILAHVDGGKTTLSESLLYNTGKIKEIGRVDHKNAYLDNNSMERQRGITIFSKQAILEYKDLKINLLDTPGHVDFSTEMERTLQVLDYAILVVSGSEGVQGHTETLWKLLEKYEIPTFIFVNKMDMNNADKSFVKNNMEQRLSDNIIEFSQQLDYEAIAMCDENILDQYMESGEVSKDDIINLIYNRKLFPCFYGSALLNEGVLPLIDALNDYTISPIYGDSFGAKVFKISKDDNGNRLTHMKITGGSLNVRDEISGTTNDEQWSEKINDIRVYSGEKYELVRSVEAGDVCQVGGLSLTYSGQGLGNETESETPNLIPVLSYSIKYPKSLNANIVYANLKELSEEDPTLSIGWNDETKEITANVMGQVQIEVLKTMISERYKYDVDFGIGKILYKETIADSVIGVGHFEPLRHYAEVQLLMEPGENGSGITFESKVNDSFLSKNWQRLIMTHIAEKQHRGVLTGAPITDIHFSLVAGKAHLKHTEGGDFRQATYRAIRQGLKKATSILLEPYYDFELKVPGDFVGKAMTDLSNLNCTINPLEQYEEYSIITGFGPVSTLWSYANDVSMYTRGMGNITLKYKGYAPCHNADEIIEAKGYDSELDFHNPTGSVFCAHGSGFNVPWDEVDNYKHIKEVLSLEEQAEEEMRVIMQSMPKPKDAYATDKELEEIFEKTFGKIKRRPAESVTRSYQKKVKPYKGSKKNILPECVLVDGYNIIFAWEELKTVAKDNIDGARDKLLDILSNYQGYKGNTVIVVFDAYNVKRHSETIYKHDNLYVVFTKAAETADMYIAKTTHLMSNKFNVKVATSDALEQLIIMGHGGIRMSANNFKEEVEMVNKQIAEKLNI